MPQEVQQVLIGCVAMSVLLFLDYVDYRRTGMSFIFGVMEHPDKEGRVQSFGFAVGVYLGIVCTIVLLLSRFSGMLEEEFCYWCWAAMVVGACVCSNALAALSMGLRLRKKDDEARNVCVIAGSFLVAIGLLTAIVLYYVFHEFQ